MSDLNKFLAAIVSGDTTGLPAPNTTLEKCLAKGLGVYNGPITAKGPMDKHLIQIAEKGFGGGGADVAITDASHLFYKGARIENCEALLALCKGITNCKEMFFNCTDAEELPGIEKLDTSLVEDMTKAFSGCYALRSLDLSGWDTRQVTEADQMFNNCASLETLLGFSLAVDGNSVPVKTPVEIMFPTNGALRRMTLRTDYGKKVISYIGGIDISQNQFDAEGLQELFESLPSLYKMADANLPFTSYPITITGNPCVDDGTLTDEIRSIATQKGWRLSE